MLGITVLSVLGAILVVVFHITELIVVPYRLESESPPKGSGFEDDLSQVPIFAEAYQMAQRPWPFMTPPYGSRLARVDLHPNQDNDPSYLHYESALSGPPFDLKAWQQYFWDNGVIEGKGTPAEDVLRALNSFEPEMSEIETAFANPHCYWPGVPPFWDSMADLNPTPSTMPAFLEVWRLRSVAYLENHQTALAEGDFDHCLQSVQSLLRNHYASYEAVAEGAMAFPDDILWEGLHRHAWSVAQLTRMESALAAIHFQYDSVTRDYYAHNPGLDDSLYPETQLRLARLACRLEEFRLAHGVYPDTFSELPELPQHLDEEVGLTVPLKYARDGDSYKLESDRENGKYLGYTDRFGNYCPGEQYGWAREYAWREP